MKIKDLMIEARAKIATPETWTQGAYARNADGESDWTKEAPNACAFCSIGAMARVCGMSGTDFMFTRQRDAFFDAFFNVGIANIVELNDSADHATVLAAWDAAIAAAP